MYKLLLLSCSFLVLLGPISKPTTKKSSALNINSNTPQSGVNIGDQAPNFSARTPQGKELSLENVLAKKGKYTLIEFWASWCPFCQREMPKVVEVYKKYHKQGLNIIGVSIDSNKDEWVKKGIRKFGMRWDQVSNLNKWNDPIVKKYGVHSIPANFLLDNNGKVIAKDLKGDALKTKMKTLFEE